MYYTGYIKVLIKGHHNMSLEKLKEKRAEQGFTIVELLIVIVIIGILAAIVIVAYTGITGQAKASKYKSNADAIRSVAETVNATQGSYPSAATATEFNASDTAKLPQGVTIVNAAASAGPAYSTDAEKKTVTDAEDTGSHYVYICGSSPVTGAKIFYTDKDGALLNVVAGKCS
jgi:prepilin-type N-terminal cleavage/methylation domain-containing protein